MGVPPEIPGFGSSATVLRVAPGFDPLKAKIGPDEYFVLSHVDGAKSVRDVLNATGLPVDRGIAIVIKLRALGAVLVPGEALPLTGAAAPSRPNVVDVPTERLPKHLLAAVDAPTMRRAPTPPRGVSFTPPAPPAVTPQPSAAAAPPPPAAPLVVASLPDPTPEELAALAEDSELPDGLRRQVLAMQRLVVLRDPWDLLGVDPGADPKTIKRAYFRLSKEIHPDRFYGRKLGSFGQRLVTVFEAVSRAYAKLTSPESVRNSGKFRAAVGELPQTPQEYAVELFDRACSLEVTGEPLEAMKLFAAAVRIDGQTRYLKRAATCALAAGQPKSAVEYAKKALGQAPDDPSAARLLAKAFRAVGNLSEAEEVLVMAMAMKNPNDSLEIELRHDLAEVRRLLAQ